MSLMGACVVNSRLFEVGVVNVKETTDLQIDRYPERLAQTESRWKGERDTMKAHRLTYTLLSHGNIVWTLLHDLHRSEEKDRHWGISDSFTTPSPMEMQLQYKRSAHISCNS